MVAEHGLEEPTLDFVVLLKRPYLGAESQVRISSKGNIVMLKAFMQFRGFRTKRLSKAG
jgi:hypothetical protein